MSIPRSVWRAFTRPRPTGSRSERATARFLRFWLRANRVPFAVHRFPLYPFFFETIGLWLLLVGTLFFVALLLQGRWWATLLAVLLPLPPLLSLRWVRPVPIARPRVLGENVLITFGPEEARAELLLAAHYDSKTELLDHAGRQRLMRVMPWAMRLALAAGLLAPWYPTAALVLGLPAWGFAVTMGLHLSLGRLLPPSHGAVDDGAACMVLLQLACRLKETGLPGPGLRVTLALFTGEEANMQGARAYARSRDWPESTWVVNLELLGQDGPYVLWAEDGDARHRVPTPPDLRAWVAQVVERVTGQAPRILPRLNTDAFAFLQAGIPAVTLGTLDSRLGMRGLHRPSDNPQRLHPARLEEHVELLWALIQDFARHHACGEA